MPTRPALTQARLPLATPSARLPLVTAIAALPPAGTRTLSLTPLAPGAGAGRKSANRCAPARVGGDKNDKTRKAGDKGDKTRKAGDKNDRKISAHDGSAWNRLLAAVCPLPTPHRPWVHLDLVVAAELSLPSQSAQADFALCCRDFSRWGQDSHLPEMHPRPFPTFPVRNCQYNVAQVHA